MGSGTLNLHLDGMPQGLGRGGNLGYLMAHGNSGLTIFFQDNVSAFVLPDDGWGQRADHITHNHSIFSFLELLWGWCILEHELL